MNESVSLTYQTHKQHNTDNQSKRERTKEIRHYDWFKWRTNSSSQQQKRGCCQIGSNSKRSSHILTNRSAIPLSAINKHNKTKNKEYEHDICKIRNQFGLLQNRQIRLCKIFTRKYGY